jgi:hypothetical protein
MDWQVVASLLVSVAALLAYFAMGETPRATTRVAPPVRLQPERKVHGNYSWAPPPPQVDAEVIDRFVAALKSQSRPTA